MKSDHIKKEEFRKNVRMIVHDKSGNVIDEIGIEVLKQYYKKVCDQIEGIERMIK